MGKPCDGVVHAISGSKGRPGSLPGHFVNSQRAARVAQERRSPEGRTLGITREVISCRWSFCLFPQGTDGRGMTKQLGL